MKKPTLNSYVGHWNSDVGIPMSNIGIPTWVFSFLPRFLPNLMIFIISINLSSFIGTIYIEKSSNLSKIWAEMRKPSLEFLRWTLEFRRRNSNVQHRYSNVGIPSPTQEFRGQGTDYQLYNTITLYNILCTVMFYILLCIGTTFCFVLDQFSIHP